MTLEQELTHLLDELADDHVVGPPPSLDTPDLALTSTERQGATMRTMVAIAAGTAIVVGGLVAIAVRRDDGSTSGSVTAPSASVPEPSATTTSPPTRTPGVAVVLAPQPDSDAIITATRDWDRSATAAGALAAPDGTVFSIYVSAGSNSLPDVADTAAIAGFEVAAELVNTQIYRTVRDDCWHVVILTADAPMWSDNLTTLLGSLRSNRQVAANDEAAITIEVPAGWQSLGGGRMQRSWTLDLEVNVNNQQHSVHLAQVPNAPVGFLLSGESNPRPFDHNGQQWWTVDDAAPGSTSLIGTTDLGAFHISSDLPAEQLAALIDSLTPTPTDQLPHLRQAPTDTAVTDQSSQDPTDTTPLDAATDGTAAPGATACGDLGTGLELVEP